MESNGVIYEWEKIVEHDNYKLHYKLYNKSDSPKEVTIELPIKIRYGSKPQKHKYGDGSGWTQMSTKETTRKLTYNLSPDETYENKYQIRSPSSSKHVKSVSYTGDINVKITDFI